MQYTESRARAGRLWVWLAISVIILLFASSSAAAQRGNSYYLSIGPAVTAGTDWGDGHEVGSGIEFGVIRRLSSSWSMLGAVGMERFPVDAPLEGWICMQDTSGRCSGSFGSVTGGKDYVFSLRGGARRGFETTTKLKPYLSALAGISMAHQDRATVDKIPPVGSSLPVERLLLQDNNDQLALQMSGLFGVATVAGRGLRLFLESGLTFVYTPDDSFDDNPLFFPVRVGIVF